MMKKLLGLTALFALTALPLIANTPATVPGDLLSPAPEIIKDTHQRITDVISATGEATHYEYFEDDERSLMKAITFPDGRREEFSRTAALFAHGVMLPFTQGLPLPDHDLCVTQNRVGFQGYFYSCSTKTYMTPAGRPYDPETGRFQTQDSYQGDVNNPPSLHRYNYGYQNPTRYSDPSGHCPAGCDPMSGAPPDVVEQVNAAQRELAAHAIQATGQLAVKIVDTAQAEAEKRYQRGQAVVIDEAADLLRNVEGKNPGPVRVGVEWVTGWGPTDRQFGPGDYMTTELQRTSALESAREQVRHQIELAKNGFVGPPAPIDAARRLREEPRLPFIEGFAKDLAGTNMTRAFLGSHYAEGVITNIDLTNNEATLEYHAENRSTGTSALRFPPDLGYQEDRPSVQRLVGTLGIAAVNAPVDFVSNLAHGQGVGASYNAAATNFKNFVAPVNPRGDWLPHTVLSDDPFGVRGVYFGGRAPMGTVTQTFDWKETVK